MSDSETAFLARPRWRSPLLRAAPPFFLLFLSSSPSISGFLPSTGRFLLSTRPFGVFSDQSLSIGSLLFLTFSSLLPVLGLSLSVMPEIQLLKP